MGKKSDNTNSNNKKEVDNSLYPPKSAKIIDYDLSSNELSPIGLKCYKDEQQLPTFKRSGFTAVEWGGVVH